MITKRNGHGQTECVGCKNKGKFALNWDSFLYNFNNEPYCFNCLLEMLDNLNKENKELRKILNIIIEDQQRSLDQARNYLIKKKNFKYYVNEFKKNIVDYEEKK